MIKSASQGYFTDLHFGLCILHFIRTKCAGLRNTFYAKRTQFQQEPKTCNPLQPKDLACDSHYSAWKKRTQTNPILNSTRYGPNRIIPPCSRILTTLNVPKIGMCELINNLPPP